MRVTRTAALLMTLSWMTANAASNPVHYNTGLGRTQKSYYKVGGDAVRFGWRMASSCDTNSLRNAATKVKNDDTSFAWDDNWYSLRVPQGRCMVFSWYNLKNGNFGWAAVQNRPSSWGVRSNSKDWVNLGNGDKQKYPYTINGQTVDLDVFNPYNQGSVGGDDIFFGFGY